MNRAKTTLFLLSSVDGKISTGSTNNMDFDKDLIHIDGVKEGLHQYYELEQKTDLWSLNTGKVMAKLGVNEGKTVGSKDITFVIIDNSHLTLKGIHTLCNGLKQLIIVTHNDAHPAFSVHRENLNILYNITFEELLVRLYNDYKCESITIQSGGTLNTNLLREGLIDKINIVLVPMLIGGKDTPTSFDGESLIDIKELGKIKVLKLNNCTILNDSYIQLQYIVINRED